MALSKNFQGGGKMTRGIVNLLASGLLMTSSVVLPSYAQVTTSDEDITVRVYQIASPAVVSIQAAGAVGSGSIIDPRGIVLTNAHVVRGANVVTVTLANRQRLQGRVISRSRNPDLALIQLQNVPANLPRINIADSNQVRVGQRAFAIGDPFGQFAGTLTTGIISRIDSDRQLLQTDAAINPGNSGGPLLNSRGELIGVNTLIFTPGQGNVGIGFAINSDTVRRFIANRPSNPVAAEPVDPLFALDGRERSFTLTPSDRRATDGSAFKTFQFSGRAGQRLEVQMSSRDVLPFLALVDPRGRRIAADDSDRVARIRVTLPITGTYRIFANSNLPGDYGRFTISGRLGSTIGNNPQPNVIFQHRGVLNENSSILPEDGSPYDTFNFRGRAGQRLRIELNSLDFRPYLALVLPNRRVLRANDDDRQLSAITLRLPVTGTYRLVANTRDIRGQGSYTLTVKSLD